MRGMRQVLDFNFVVAEIYRTAGDHDPQVIATNLPRPCGTDLAAAVRELRRLSASIGGVSWVVSFPVPNGEELDPAAWSRVPGIYLENAGLFTVYEEAGIDGDYATYLGIRSGRRKAHILVCPVAGYTRRLVDMSGASGRSRRAVAAVLDELAMATPAVLEVSDELEVVPMD